MVTDVRTLLLILMVVTLLLVSVTANAHLDLPSSSTPTVCSGVDHGPGPDHRSGGQQDRDLCGHGFGHLAMFGHGVLAFSFQDVVRVAAPLAPASTLRVDRLHRPPR